MRDESIVWKGDIASPETGVTAVGISAADRIDAVRDAALRSAVTHRAWYVVESGDDCEVRDNYAGAWQKRSIVGPDGHALRFEPDFCYRVWFRDGSGILVEARSEREARLVAIVHASAQGSGQRVRRVEEL